LKSLRLGLSPHTSQQRKKERKKQRKKRFLFFGEEKKSRVKKTGIITYCFFCFHIVFVSLFFNLKNAVKKPIKSINNFFFVVVAHTLFGRVTVMWL